MAGMPLSSAIWVPLAEKSPRPMASGYCDEALAWARRFPAPFPGQPFCIEVRPLMGGIDLPPEDAERVIREQLAAIKRRDDGFD
jgi:hypothetical protein